MKNWKHILPDELPKSFIRMHGFTLIELLVVISVIAVLASITLASLNTARRKGRDARRIGDLAQLRFAIESYHIDNRVYPPFGAVWVSSYPAGNANWLTLEGFLSKYLPQLPRDPLNNGASTWLTGQYSYVYGYNTAPPTGAQRYDLITQLEDTTNNNRCAVKCWKYYDVGDPWCETTSGGNCPGTNPLVNYGYSPYIYANH